MLARSRDHVGILSAATGGDLARSERWREILSPYGVGDELRCVVADEYGSWGDFMLFRGSDESAVRRRGRAADAPRLRRAGPRASSARDQGDRGAGESTPTETGVLLLDSRLQPCGATARRARLVHGAQPRRDPVPRRDPGTRLERRGAAARGRAGRDPARPVRVRARAADGRWAIVEAARLDGSEPGSRSRSARPVPTTCSRSLSRAAGLTPRERELVALLLEGLATRELAERLFISRHTVQDHLKSVFEKVGVRSRRELLTGVFSQAA